MQEFCFAHKIKSEAFSYSGPLVEWSAALLSHKGANEGKEGRVTPQTTTEEHALPS